MRTEEERNKHIYIYIFTHTHIYTRTHRPAKVNKECMREVDGGRLSLLFFSLLSVHTRTHTHIRPQTPITSPRPPDQTPPYPHRVFLHRPHTVCHLNHGATHPRGPALPTLITPSDSRGSHTAHRIHSRTPRVRPFSSRGCIRDKEVISVARSLAAAKRKVRSGTTGRRRLLSTSTTSAVGPPSPR